MNNQMVYDFALILSGVFLTGGIVYFTRSNEFKNLISEFRPETVKAENYSEMEYTLPSSIVNSSTLDREMEYVKFSEESRKIANSLNGKTEGGIDFITSVLSAENRKKRMIQFRSTVRKSESRNSEMVWTRLFESTAMVH